MGVGFEFILDLGSVKAASSAERFSLDVHIIGRCEKGAGSNTLEIHSRFGDFHHE